jgi:2OG-Fe(II) oxygenase superfamily
MTAATTSVPARLRAVPTTPAPNPPLRELIAHRRWVRRTVPFPHVVATNVFVADFYQRLHDQFLALLRDRPQAFNKGIANYDAAAADIGPYDGPLSLFVSREWHDLLGALTGVTGTGDMIATMHHHDPGSRRGWPHNDLAPGWFGGPPPCPDEVRLAGVDGVGYRDGTRPDGVSARPGVRAASALFYVANEPWQPGDGGETGLFSSGTGRQGPAAVVPPVNNSLVIFECTPYSQHTFLGARKPRNSVVMWIHRPLAETVQRWGERSIVYW